MVQAGIGSPAAPPVTTVTPFPIFTIKSEPTDIFGEKHMPIFTIKSEPTDKFGEKHMGYPQSAANGS